VNGDTISVANQVGFATIELTLEVVDEPDTDLTYEQREGIFEEMRTDYVVESHEGGTKLTARTEFALDVAVVGDVLDATIIKRQRRKELAAQFDWVEEVTTRDGTAKSTDT
jgi:glycerol-3-phosphate cytidylyltransferase-like family protein